LVFGVGEAIAAAAAFKAAVDGIKSAIGTANDVRDIASQIDQLLDSKSRIDKAKNKKVAPGQFSISSIASETIDAKLAEESLQEIRTLVDLRFGHGVFQSILDERKKRIKEYKEAQIKLAKQKAAQRAELMNDLKLFVWILLGSIVAVMGVIAVFLVDW
jgi:NADH dehydrogenase/NADH:ubiquinone oxidoreductase subunit G